MSIISEISNFNFRDRPELVAMYERITKDKQMTRNGAIYEIMVSGFSELEKIVLAMNLSEFRALELQQEQMEQIIATTSQQMEKMFGISASEIKNMINSTFKKDEFIKRAWVKKTKGV